MLLLISLLVLNASLISGIDLGVGEAQIPRYSFRMRCPEIHLDSSNPQNYCSERLLAGTLMVGELCLLRPAQAHPTQSSIGKVLARCITRQLEKGSRKYIRKYVRALQVPTVVGPDGTFYITDNHHLAYALFEAQFEFSDQMKSRVMYSCIDSDYSDMSVNAFHSIMEARHSIYLKNEKGLAIDSINDIPTTLKDMADDPFRTLADWVGQSNGYIKCGNMETEHLQQCSHSGDAPLYLEFTWANFLRERLPIITSGSVGPDIHPHLKNFIYQTNMQSQVDGLLSVYDQALILALSTAAQDMSGYNWSRDVMTPLKKAINSQGCMVDDVVKSTNFIEALENMMKKGRGEEGEDSGFLKPNGMSYYNRNHGQDGQQRLRQDSL